MSSTVEVTGSPRWRRAEEPEPRESESPEHGRPSHQQRWLRRAGALCLGYAGTGAVLVALNFALPRAMPGDPLTALLVQGSPSYLADSAQREQLREFYGLDQPWSAQLQQYIGGLVTGDLGISLGYRLPVGALLAERLPSSLLLVGTALLLGAAAGIAAGSVAGWHRAGRLDSLALAGLAVVRGTPVFFLASIVCYVGAVRLGWFPVSGSGTRFVELAPFARALDVAWHLALPAGVLALGHFAATFALMRAGMVTQLSADYLLAARAAGLPERVVRRQHAGRNALVPVVGGLSIEAGTAITGAVMVEAVFAYEGVGSLLVHAIETRDYPLMQGCFLLLGGLVLAAGLVADLILARLDPRQRTRVGR